MIGREAEILDLEKCFETTNQVLLVNGMGGIGKTELCKVYFNKHKNDYKYIGWIDYTGNIKESLVNQIKSNVLTIYNDETLDEQYEKVMGFLYSLKESALIVIDNIENENDENLNEIRKLPFKVLASSRIKLNGFQQYSLGFLSYSDCKKVFYSHYSIQNDDVILDKIIELAGKHTLTIELLAKTAENAVLRIKELYEYLIESGFNINDIVKETVTTFWNGESEELFFNHLLKVFKLSNITQEEKYILINLAVMPSNDININKLKEWLYLESNNAINSLIKKGWINRNQDCISIHPLIQETIRYKEKPNSQKCKKLIESITRTLNVYDSENPLNKREYVVIGEHILKNINEENNETANLINNLAGLYHNLGQLDKCLEFQLKVKMIKEKILDENDDELALVYNNLVSIYKDLGKLDKSLEFSIKAVSIGEMVLDEKDSDLARYYSSLSMVYLDLGKLDESLNYQLKAIAIQEQAISGYDSHLATYYSNVSLIYEILGKLDKSLEYQLKAVDIREKLMDEYHPDLIASYDILAMIYKDLGKLDKALELELKAVRLSEKVLDSTHPELATSYNNLSMIYKELQKLDKSLEYQLKSITIKEKNMDSNHPELAIVYNNVSLIYLERGNIEMSLEFQLKALTIREKVLDKDHIMLANSYSSLANIYYVMGRLDLSLKYQFKDLHILEKVLDKNHPDLAKSYNCLATIYYSLGEIKKCFQIQRKALRIQERILNSDHPDLAVSYNILSIIYEGIGNIKESLRYRKKSMAIKEKNNMII